MANLPGFLSFFPPMLLCGACVCWWWWNATSHVTIDLVIQCLASPLEKMHTLNARFIPKRDPLCRTMCVMFSCILCSSVSMHPVLTCKKSRRAAGRIPIMVLSMPSSRQKRVAAQQPRDRRLKVCSSSSVKSCHPVFEANYGVFSLVGTGSTPHFYFGLGTWMQFSSTGRDLGGICLKSSVTGT